MNEAVWIIGGVIGFIYGYVERMWEHWNGDVNE